MTEVSVLYRSLGKNERQVDNLFLRKCPRIKFPKVHQMMLLQSLLLGVQGCREMRLARVFMNWVPTRTLAVTAGEAGDALPWLASLLSS